MWKAHNSVIFNQHSPSHLECFSVALSLLSEFQALHRHPRPLQPLRSSLHWLPPPINWHKLNSDASLGLNGEAGLGGVIRDHRGVVVSVFSHFLSSCEDVELAEACACRLGISKAFEFDVRALAIETDNLHLAGLLQCNCIPRSPLGSVVADILHLSRNFDHVSFLWTSRACNGFANEVARLARSSQFSCDCLIPLPVSLRRIAAFDAAPND